MAAAERTTLEAVPDLGKLYAQAAAQLAVVKAGARGLAPGLASTELVVDGVEIDVARLTEFQHLVGARASDVVPPSFLHVVGFPLTIALMTSRSSPVVAVGMVHIRNHVEQLAPVTIGDTLSLRARLENLAPHKRGATLDAIVDAYRGDTKVFTTVSTHLAKGNFAAGQVDDEDARPEFSPPVPTGRWRFTAADVRSYAEASGDRNPIHMNTLAAKAFGFPSIIAHGMFSASKALAALDPRGDTFAWDVTFAAPVVVPASVAVRVAPDDEGGTVTGWNAKKGRLHFASSVSGLPANGPS